MSTYEPTIGLEIHSELKTKSKMFCSCANDPDESHANVNVCPICLGHPGTLPTINEQAIKKLLMVGAALNCKIAEFSKFDRKNYFYPDLPKGYQISQYDLPVCGEGWLELATSSWQLVAGNLSTPGVKRLKENKRIRITRIHMEEDAGRLVHSTNLAERRGLNADSRENSQRNSASSQRESATLVDYNRAGVPLMELVTEPDLKSAEDVRRFATELRLILRYLGASDADMEKGQMRVEVNISLRLRTDADGTQTNADKIQRNSASSLRESAVLGTKVEVKNINSISAAGRAVEYEIKRQTELLEAGEKIVQETRGWDEDKGKTVSQRLKEGSADYRYFPEPDLPPLRFKANTVEDVRAVLPELPQARRERFLTEYNLLTSQVEIFTVNKKLGDFFEKVASEILEWHKFSRSSLEKPGAEHNARLFKLAANYLITELQKLLSNNVAFPHDRDGMQQVSYAEEEADESIFKGLKLTPENFAEFVVRIHNSEVSSSGAQTLLAEMFATGKNVADIIQEMDLGQVSDEASLVEAVERVIANNAKAVEDYKKGKTDALKFLIGQAMRETKGKANPEVLAEIFKKKLG